MKICYIREMRRSYLTVEPEGAEQQEEGAWEAGMLEENRIRGLLPMKVRYREGKALYCYDITSRQPLERLLENHPVTAKEVRSLFWQIYRTLEEMEGYLLRSGGILLEPELIYVEPEYFEVGICAVPGGTGDFSFRFSHFLQYLLKQVDHRDRDCVVLAYGLYQESLKENYGIEDLVKIVTGEGGETGEREIVRQKPEDRETVKEKQEKNIALDEKGEQKKEFGEAPGTEQPDAERNGEKNEKTEGILRCLLRCILTAAAIFLAAAGGIWLLRGWNTLLSVKWVLAGAGGLTAGLTAAVTAAGTIAGNKRFFGKKERQNQGEEDPWRILYEDEDEDAPENVMDATEDRKPPVRENTVVKSLVPEEFQTVLLAEQSSAEPLHCLVSADPVRESIEIPYYPFVIGKHRNLADYILDHSTVSRFHIRLDREGDCFTVTDLNSTNGTTVAGVCLAANGTAELKEGDQVQIAELCFIWK